jgi:hypothetical protein
VQNAAWISLLRHIPAEHQSNLILTMSTGTDIAIQTILRAEKDYLVIRGRLTGTTDGGGFFFVPFDQISFMGFQRAVHETEVRTMFGEPAASAGAAHDSAANPGENGTPDQAPAPAVAPPDSAPPGVGGPPGPPGYPKPRAGTAKAALLERLRARRAGSDPNQPQ